MISRDSLNEAYSGLEAKHNEIIRALTHRIFELESGWYNGHYQKDPDGKWVRDAYTRDCVLKQGIACCGACEQFPCDTIMTRPHTTVPDKDWLRWKKKSRCNR